MVTSEQNNNKLPSSGAMTNFTTGGIPLSRYYDASHRHLWSLMEGKIDEDHFGAVLWNIACWQKTKNMIDRGLLPQELDDLTQ